LQSKRDEFGWVFIIIIISINNKKKGKKANSFGEENAIKKLIMNAKQEKIFLYI